jgi:hypothetical protein
MTPMTMTRKIKQNNVKLAVLEIKVTTKFRFSVIFLVGPESGSGSGSASKWIVGSGSGSASKRCLSMTLNYRTQHEKLNYFIATAFSNFSARN